METIAGPIAQLGASAVIYQVTLASGMVITSPTGFGEDQPTLNPPAVVVSESGEILSGPRDANGAFPGSKR